jgi:hypothetical protein
MPLKYQDYPLSATFYGTFFRFFPHAHVGLKAAAGGDEEVGVLGELVSAQHAVVYGDVYLYHDTHLHPSKFFFTLLYVSIYTYNEHVSKQYSYSLIIILIIQTIANI